MKKHRSPAPRKLAVPGILHIYDDRNDGFRGVDGGSAENTLEGEEIVKDEKKKKKSKHTGRT
jgi:hypothetical protein